MHVGPIVQGVTIPATVLLALYTTSGRRHLDTDGRKLAKSPAMRACALTVAYSKDQ